MAYPQDIVSAQYYFAHQAAQRMRAGELAAKYEAQLIENSRAEIDCIRRGLPPDAWKNKT